MCIVPTSLSDFSVPMECVCQVTQHFDDMYGFVEVTQEGRVVLCSCELVVDCTSVHF